MYLVLAIMMALCISHSRAEENSTVSSVIEPIIESSEPVGCVCGIFLNGQFKKGSKEQPKGHAALIHDYPGVVPCNTIGNKLCTSKCLDAIVKYLPNSAAIICASIDRDCYKERASLFIKNCKDEWMNTNLSAGREYCCKDGSPYKCR